MKHRKKSKNQEEGKLYLLAKLAIFLAIAQILLSIIFPQEAQTQEITEHGISALKARLEHVKGKLASTDDSLTSLKKEFNLVINKRNLLEEEEANPKGFLSKLPGMGILRRRKLGGFYTRSQELADEMGSMEEERKSLVKEFISLADELIEKSSLRMIALMKTLREAALSDDTIAWQEVSKQWSYLWDLAERTREAKKKYAPDTPERRIEPPVSFSDDPKDLQLRAAALRDAAAAEWAKAAQLGDEIGELERKERHLKQQLELSKEIQRREEEREATGILSQIPWGSDAAIERDIEDIGKDIDKRKSRKREHEEKAQRYQRRAEQIDVQLEGKSEND